jgi:hypothetical protein
LGTLLSTEVITLIKQLNEIGGDLCKILKKQTQHKDDLKESIINAETTINEIKFAFGIITQEGNK